MEILHLIIVIALGGYIGDRLAKLGANWIDVLAVISFYWVALLI